MARPPRKRRARTTPKVGSTLRTALGSRPLGTEAATGGESDYVRAAKYAAALEASAKAAAPAAGTDGLNADFASRLNMMIAQSGGRISIRSGYRSIEEQQRLWNANPNPKWVAPPGKSNHNKGTAADLGFSGNDAIQWAHQNAARFGLTFPMAHENWHIEPVGVRENPETPPEAYTDPATKTRPPTAQEAMAHVSDIHMRELGGIAEGIVEKQETGQQITPEEALVPEQGPTNEPVGVVGADNPAEAIQRPELGEEVPQPVPEAEVAVPAAAPAGGETGEGGDAETWIREAMRITGVDESWYPGLKARMMQESGGRNIPQGIVDINTQKGTPAFGPMQVIEPTFRSHALPGYQNWKDPLHNTIAAIQYIKGRYGHPSKLPKGGY